MNFEVLNKDEMNRLYKHERTASLSETEKLFSQGNRFMAYPFSVRFILLPSTSCSVSALLTAPKRYQKTAINRNRAKRLLRETYRKQKHVLYSHLEERKQRLVINICLVSKQMPTYLLTEQKMDEIIRTIVKKTSHEND